MDLTTINHKIYPRAVTASAEGHLRAKSRAQQSTHAYSGAGSSAQTQRRSGTQSEAEVARQYQEQRADQRSYAGQRRANEAGVSGLGDQLAAASRQARHTHVRRRYYPPAMISTRGREANRRYLDTSVASQPRIIDEVV